MLLWLPEDLIQAADIGPNAGRSRVKIAAVQISDYDKGELPRQGYDVVATLLPYIDQAKEDGADLVVFPSMSWAIYRCASWAISGTIRLGTAW